MSHSDAPPPRRGIGVADILILFAATAAALGWLQKPLERRLTFISDGRIIENLRPATLVGAAFAATWGVGLLAIRLRPPRPGGTGDIGRGSSPARRRRREPSSSWRRF